MNNWIESYEARRYFPYTFKSAKEAKKMANAVPSTQLDGKVVKVQRRYCEDFENACKKAHLGYQLGVPFHPWE